VSSRPFLFVEQSYRGPSPNANNRLSRLAVQKSALSGDQRHQISSHDRGKVGDALRAAKSDAVDDATVISRLRERRETRALRFEQEIRSQGRIDFDDLVRHCERLLGIEPVRSLYRAHFAAVVVDEIQDLTLQQFRVIRAIGEGRTTFAGDLAQGIYSFAGASPGEVFALVRSSCSGVIELHRSYRSTPNVLLAVNALAGEMGVTRLTCANPKQWKSAGTVAVLPLCQGSCRLN
jgi:DNA helicase-2/ATP-dependent DNA helicase PcrA